MWRRTYFAAIIAGAVAYTVFDANATVLTGTNGNDLFSFQGDQHTVSTAITNPYTGETITLNGTFNVNQVSYDGLGGIDTLFMTNASDLLFIEDFAGNQIVSGIEVFFAGDGRDVIDLASNNFVLGHVTVDGGSSDDIIWSNAGNDLLNGRGGNDIVNGGPGNDTVNSGPGNDIVDGGPGNDIVDGGPGNDDIFFRIGSGVDFIDGGGDFDKINFAAGISLSDLLISGNGVISYSIFSTFYSNVLDNFDFDIRVGNGGDRILLSNVEQLSFDDGSILDLTTFNFPAVQVSEPASLTLFGFSLLGLGFFFVAERQNRQTLS